MSYLWQQNCRTCLGGGEMLLSLVSRKLCFGHHLLLSLQKLNVFLESVMSAGLIEDGTVAADMTKVWSSV